MYTPSFSYFLLTDLLTPDVYSSQETVEGVSLRLHFSSVCTKLIFKNEFLTDLM